MRRHVRWKCVWIQPIPVGLHVDTPLLRVEAVGLEGAVPAEVLHLVHHLVAAVVARAGQALRVLYVVVIWGWARESWGRTRGMGFGGLVEGIVRWGAVRCGASILLSINRSINLRRDETTLPWPATHLVGEH